MGHFFFKINILIIYRSSYAEEKIKLHEYKNNAQYRLQIFSRDRISSSRIIFSAWHYLGFNASILFEIRSHNCPMGLSTVAFHFMCLIESVHHLNTNCRGTCKCPIGKFSPFHLSSNDEILIIHANRDVQENATSKCKMTAYIWLNTIVIWK